VQPGKLRGDYFATGQIADSQFYVMFRMCETAVVVLAGLWLVQGQAGTVRQADYDVLRNTSSGPVVCAMDQPQLVHNEVRSRLHCSTTCLQNDQCSSFNYKNVSATASGFTCEHFNGYPSSFTVDSNCRHYAVSALYNPCIIRAKLKRILQILYGPKRPSRVWL